MSEIKRDDAALMAAAPEMLEMLKIFKRAEELLQYPSDTGEEHAGEAQAVANIFSALDKLLAKIEQ